MAGGERRDGMERLLGVVLRAPDDEEPSGCPDTETMAAFAEGVLTPAERTRVTRHSADCARCQAVLASMARTAPVPEAAPVGRWFGALLGPRLRWLVPVSSLAAASLALYVVMREPAGDRTADSLPGTSVGAPATPSESPDRIESPALAQPSTPAPREGQRAPGALADTRREAEQEARRNEARGASPPDAAKRTAPRESDQRAAAAPAGTAERGATADALRERQRKALEAQRKAEAIESASVAREAEPPRQEALRDAPASPAAASPRADTAAPSSGDVPAPQLATGGLSSTLQVRAPDGSTIWRIGPGSAASRSVDGGRSWTPVPHLPGVPLAASAPSASVLWVVGRDGFAAQATRQGRWAVVSPPARTDLVSVAALDAERAVATARDGRRFQTEDGGASWTVVGEPR